MTKNKNMKIKIYGLEADKLKAYIQKNFSENFQILNKKDSKKPEMIICYGGDGTLLMAEREIPGIPKVSVRNSQICDKCKEEIKNTIFKLICQKKYYLAKHHKIEASISKKKIIAMNDIIIGHFYINTALRFKVFINNVQYGGEFLGDGLVAATPVGSTAYYQAITRSNFQKGVGIAFNNTVNSIGHLVVKSDTQVRVEITRGPGRLRYDNARDFIALAKGDIVNICRSNECTEFVNFYSPHNNLNVDISQNRLPLGYCQVCRRYYRDN